MKHITINSDRSVTVPVELRKIGVQYDHNVNTIEFVGPRYSGNVDLSTMTIYINYILSDKTPGKYKAENVIIDDQDDSLIRFNWTITRNVTKVSGILSCLVCAKKTDEEGNEINHWNTDIFRLLSVSEGMENDPVIQEQYPDVITSLIQNVEEHDTKLLEFSGLNNRVTDLENNVDEHNAKLLEFSGLNVRVTDLENNVDELKGDFNDYKDSISEYHKSVNLFDKSKITDGKVLLGRNTEQTVSSCFYTDYIPVEGGKTYCFQDNTGYLGQNGKVVCCYDANKTFLFSIPINNVIVRDGAVIFTINKSKYVRVNGRTSRLDSFMFVEGETLPSYEPYFEPYYEIKREALPSDIPLPKNLEYNPLYGKKLCVDGDSIMYGAGSSGGFAKIIGDNNSMTVVNNAVSGGTIASGTYHSDGTTARHWICDTIKNIPSDADYILFDGGVNDSSETAEVGAISSGFSAELDTTTFCGAMESICKWLVINRPNAKIGYVIVHKMADNYTSEYPSAGTKDMYGLAIKICKKWGVPYIDLNTQVPPLKDIQSLRDVYTSNADGWHPNELGYKTFYVPKIEAFLRTL